MWGRLFHRHDWRDVKATRELLYQECAGCGARRIYHKGIGARAVTWSDGDLHSDGTAVIRVVVTADGKPAGLAIIEEGTLTPQEIEAFALAIRRWEEDPSKFLVMEEGARVRLRFVTVEQLTAEG